MSNKELHIEVGDEVLVKAKVLSIISSGPAAALEVETYLGGYIVHVMVGAIESVIPKPLKVGDTVVYNGGDGRSNPGEIRHIIDGDAWVTWRHGVSSIMPLSNLKRVRKACGGPDRVIQGYAGLPPQWHNTKS